MFNDSQSKQKKNGTGVLYWSRLFGRILKSFLSRLLEARFMGAGVRGRSHLLGEGICGPVRLARLGIGMISKPAQKDGTSIVH
jgi:hypothetical protein